jgi:methylated-DNA-[protein]-cysteine S-methyltransferase
MPAAGTTLYSQMPSPVGDLLLVGDDDALRGLYMAPHEVGAGWRRADAPFAAARGQLEEYFAGERRAFDLPLRLDGTSFQRLVWQALREIPYGETWSYGQLARHVGRPSAARAVGLANGRNPISIIVPCHRVIGSDRSLTGYGGGLERKRRLLDLEIGVSALDVGRVDAR